MSVASAAEFEKSIAADFNYDITPTAFNIALTIAQNGGGVANKSRKVSFMKGFGSPELHANRMKSGSNSVSLSCEFAAPFESEFEPTVTRPVAPPTTTTPSGLSNFVPSTIMKWLPSWPSFGLFSQGSNGGNGDDAHGGSPSIGGAKRIVASPLGTGTMMGGILVFELAGYSPNDQEGTSITLHTSWCDRDGMPQSHEQEVHFESPGSSGLGESLEQRTQELWCSSDAIRKALALVRYVDLQSEYVLDDKDAEESFDSDGDDDDEDEDHRFIMPMFGSHGSQKVAKVAKQNPPTKQKLKSWLPRHQSYVLRFQNLKQHLLREMEAVGDFSLIAASDGDAGSSSGSNGVSAMDDTHAGSNQSVIQTVEQILEMECEAVKKIQRLLSAPRATKPQSSPKKSKRQSRDSVPNEYLCPITNCIMNDPVLAKDGFSYERDAIEKWFKQGNKKTVRSPMTNVPMELQLVPNRVLRALIDNFNEKCQKGSQTKRRRAKR